MLREKPANELAVQRLTSFLKWIRYHSTQTPQSVNVEYFIQSEQVAKRSFSDLKRLGIVKVNKESITWVSKDDDRTLALKILDYRLKKSKKQVHVPIPEFAAIGESLKTIAERLAVITVQYEKSLKQSKNIEITGESDMFKVEDQRLYIAGQVAAGIYSDFKGTTITAQAIEKTNKTIVSITDDLIRQLLIKGD